MLELRIAHRQSADAEIGRRGVENWHGRASAGARSQGGGGRGSQLYMKIACNGWGGGGDYLDRQFAMSGCE